MPHTLPFLRLGQSLIDDYPATAERLTPFHEPRYLAARAPTWGYWLTPGGFAAPMIVLRKAGLRYGQLTGRLIGLKSGHAEPTQQDFDSFWQLADRMDFLLSPVATAYSRLVPAGAHSLPFGTLWLSLIPTEDQLLAAMHHKHRYKIRKAEREGVEIRWGLDQADRFYQLLRRTSERQDRAQVVSRREFDSLVAGFAEHVEIVMAYDPKGAQQGGALYLWNAEGCYYLYGASADDPQMGAINLLHWRVMQTMRARGVPKYDFVGARPTVEPNSKLAGIQDFKERFGSQFDAGFLWTLTFRPARRTIYDGLKWIQGKL